MPTYLQSLEGRTLSLRGLFCALHGFLVLAIPLAPWFFPILGAVLPNPLSGMMALFCAFWGFWVTTATWQGSPRTFGAGFGFFIGLACWLPGTAFLLLGWAFSHMRT